ncbi:MAG: 50S ribosomal protein L4 [Patescibacteria group bacterium]
MPKTKIIKSKKTSSKKPAVTPKLVRSLAPKSPKLPKSPQSPESPKPSSVSVSVVGIDGKSVGKMTLPAELFAAKVNDALVAQAVRVYLANQREGAASTKTRGDVEGSTRKIYRQKGTGRARHGGIRAPIFVGGGITFGPHPRDYHLDLPQKMKRAALASALTSALGEGKMIIVSGLEGLTKTKDMAHALQSVGVTGSALLVVDGGAITTSRAARNIADVDILPAQDLHAYTVLTHQKLVFMKEAVEVLKKRFAQKKSV